MLLERSVILCIKIISDKTFFKGFYNVHYSKFETNSSHWIYSLRESFISQYKRGVCSVHTFPINLMQCLKNLNITAVCGVKFKERKHEHILITLLFFQVFFDSLYGTNTNPRLKNMALQFSMLIILRLVDAFG